MIHIRKITFDAIREVWKEHMPNMSLEPSSAMSCFQRRVWIPTSNSDGGGVWQQEDHYDLQNQTSTPTFWGAFDEDKLIGCNSGHMTINNMYRSRGLFVKEEYRGQGIAQKLLLKTVSQGVHEKAYGIWSYPTESAFSVYGEIDFQLKGHQFNFDWVEDTDGKGMHSRAIKTLRESGLESILANESIIATQRYWHLDSNVEK